ncbi:MAG TPA: hypothetical protein VMH80_23965 [Bryobacteraceae bacterium]|nr:hypothetical protein [Bryobacteraceae bacterium]
MQKLLGAILIVIGIVAIAWGGFTYTSRKKILDIGPIQATQKQKHEVPISPIAGAVALIGGVVLVTTGRR